MSADPLAGLRRRIGEERDLDHLIFCDRGRGCPVAAGEMFSLRTCQIEITRTQRTRQGGAFVWVAWFRRHYPEGRPFLLARGAGDGHGYTRDPDLAQAAGDDPDATTLIELEPDGGRARQPPEAEAVAPHEVATLPTSVAARARFEEVALERWAALERTPIAERVGHVRERIAERGPDAEAWRAARTARGQAKRAASRAR